MTLIAFPRWALIVGLVLLVVWFAALALGLVGIYVADEYMTPALNEQSVPPARAY